MLWHPVIGILSLHSQNSASFQSLIRDFDGDGDIDGDGFLIWQNSFPTTNGTAISFIGDATGDGKVDGEDFLVWQNIFPFSVALSEAPEPASLGMLALGNLLMWPHRLEAR